jgi:hypothetical protein
MGGSLSLVCPGRDSRRVREAAGRNSRLLEDRQADRSLA